MKAFISLKHLLVIKWSSSVLRIFAENLVNYFLKTGDAFKVSQKHFLVKLESCTKTLFVLNAFIQESKTLSGSP